jgi:polar amino acid transport system substrate-binding protein
MAASAWDCRRTIAGFEEKDFTLSKWAVLEKLRVGIASAPAMSALFVVLDAKGTPRGVTVDLANDLGKQLGLPVEFMIASNTGLLTDAVEAGTIDVAFMPVDAERQKRIDFGPAYYIIESTYMVTGASGIKTVDEVDRAGIRIVGIANTTTIRAAGRSLQHTVIMPASSIDAAVAMLHDGSADAFALSRDALPPFVAGLRDSRMTDGGFQHTGIAVAVQKNRHEALDFVTQWMERAKATGVVRRALDAAGLKNELVAP